MKARGLGVFFVFALLLASVTFAWSGAEAKSVTLKYGTHMPERHICNELGRWWAEQISKKTDGQLKIQFFYSEALGPGKDHLDNIKYGVYEIATVLAPYDPAKSPLWNLPFIPWVSSEDPWVRAMALVDVSKLPVMKEELARWDAEFLFPWALGDVYYLWTTKKPVYKLDDLKGLKIRSIGEMAESLSLVGANPVAMPMPDVTDSLSKGILDGGCLATAPVMGYKLFEICKYKTTMLLGMGGPMYVVKKSVMEKLPADFQKAIREASMEMIKHMAEKEAEYLKKADQTFQEAGVTVIPFPPEEQEKYEKVGVMPVIEKWIKSNVAKGLPAREAWEALKAATAKYKNMPH